MFSIFVFITLFDDQSILVSGTMASAIFISLGWSDLLSIVGGT
jgi:hypothetical protein